MKKNISLSKRFLLIALLFVSTTSVCQQQDTFVHQEIDTAKILLNAKVYLIPFMNSIESPNDVCDFLLQPIEYSFLKSKGFAKHVIFFKIKITWNKNTNYQFLYDDILIFAYNNRSKKIYRLKGLEENDFRIFYEDLKYSNIDFTSAGEDDLNSKKEFLNSFQVVGLDLDCLFDSLKKHRRILPCEQPITPFTKR